MALSIKILVLGVFLSLISLATGHYLESRSKELISSKIKNCHSEIKLPNNIDKSIVTTVRFMEDGYFPKDKDLIPDTKTYALVIEYIKLIDSCSAYNNRIKREHKNDWKEIFNVVAIVVSILGALPFLLKIALPYAWRFFLLRVRELSNAITGKQ